MTSVKADLPVRSGCRFSKSRNTNEKAVNRIGSGMMIDLAKALRTDLNYFFGDMGKKVSQTESAYRTFMQRREGPMIIEAMLAIKNQEHRRAVIALARNLAGIKT